jgi:hypothetical protein
VVEVEEVVGEEVVGEEVEEVVGEEVEEVVGEEVAVVGRAEYLRLRHPRRFDCYGCQPDHTQSWFVRRRKDRRQLLTASVDRARHIDNLWFRSIAPH